MGKIGKFVIFISLPFILLMFFVNLMMSTTFLRLEYGVAWFPMDPYGFSQADRLNFGSTVIEYITSSEDRALLDGLRDQNGNPIFIAREVDHLVDVKNVLVSLNQAYLVVTIIAAFFVSSSVFRKSDDWRSALRGGAIFTLMLLVAIGAFALTSFWTFFEKFHAIFFEGDSWLFYNTDAIIRLFPLQLWQDAVLYLVVAVILSCLGIIFWLKPKH